MLEVCVSVCVCGGRQQFRNHASCVFQSVCVYVCVSVPGLAGRSGRSLRLCEDPRTGSLTPPPPPPHTPSRSLTDGRMQIVTRD